MSESMLTSEAASTSEGQGTSQVAASEVTPAQGQGTEQSAQQQQATEGQTTEGQKAEGEGAEGDAGKPAEKVGAPEKYEFKAPEGQSFDDAVIAQFSEVAKELDLPQDAAQKILDKVGPTILARQTEAIEAAKTQWADTTKADKEIGGEKLDENLAAAKKALDKFGTPELRALLNQSGLGNHPELIRVFVRAGKAISEDRFVSASVGGPAANRSHAAALYPSQQQ